MEMIEFDRSRRELDEKCPRARYWGYESYDGQGIERKAQSQDLAFGQAFHHAMAIILEHVKENDGIPSRDAIAFAIKMATYRLEEEFDKRGFASRDQVEVVEIDPFSNDPVVIQPDTMEWLALHMADLLQALVWGWVLCRLPEIVKDFRVVEVEAEKRLPIMANDGLFVFMSRADCHLQRRSTGGRVLLNFKTTKEIKGWWLEQWSTDQQMISEILPIEHETGQIVEGVMIEGVLKGRTSVEWPKDSGKWHYNSPLVWGYRKAADGFEGEMWMPPQGRLNKGWERMPTTNFTGGIEGWVNSLTINDPEVVRSQFICPPLISRQASELAEWQIQSLAREGDIRLARLNLDDKPESLAVFFPKHTHHGNCIFPTRCEYYDCCWNTIEPLQSGLYQIRVPNHPSEERLSSDRL
jgi:hypothetical protein